MCMGIGKNIKFHRDERLKWTLQQLSDACGGNPDVGTIGALEIRDSIRSKYFGAIAKAMGLTLDELQLSKEDWLKFHEEELLDTHDSKLYKNYPRVVGTAHMGDKGYYLDLDGGDGYVEFESTPGSIAIRVRGDCMFPAIRDGWYVIIEPNGRPTIGEYVLLKFNNGKKMVKELLQIKADCYVVMEVNGKGRITALKNELDDIQAITAVIPPSKHKEWSV